MSAILKLGLISSRLVRPRSFAQNTRGGRKTGIPQTAGNQACLEVVVKRKLAQFLSPLSGRKNKFALYYGMCIAVNNHVKAGVVF